MRFKPDNPKASSARRIMTQCCVMLIAFFAQPLLFAQSDCFEKTISAHQIKGKVADLTGETIAHAHISLVQNGKRVSEVETDAEGGFLLTPAPGKYELRATASGFATAWAPLTIRRAVIFSTSAQRVWLILGIGSEGPCPTSTTSEREFKKLIQQFKHKFKQGKEEKNAAQK